MAEFEFTAFIENLNSRTRNFISGAHLTFPTTTEMVQATLNIIGVDGLRKKLSSPTIPSTFRVCGLYWASTQALMN